jgi:hypothetical protein
MTCLLTVQIPDELRGLLLQIAAKAGRSPEEWIVAVVCQRLAERDEKLRRHFGAVNLGAPTGVDNTRIDADLTEALTTDHHFEQAGFLRLLTP